MNKSWKAKNFQVRCYLCNHLLFVTSKKIEMVSISETHCGIRKDTFDIEVRCKRCKKYSWFRYGNVEISNKINKNP